LANADLLIEEAMPECFLDLCAHTCAYRAVLARWAKNDFSEHTSILEFPTAGLVRYTADSYKRLKAEQAHLLALTHDPARRGSAVRRR
jgi:hypothetical protein